MRELDRQALYQSVASIFGKRGRGRGRSKIAVRRAWTDFGAVLAQTAEGPKIRTADAHGFLSAWFFGIGGPNYRARCVS